VVELYDYTESHNEFVLLLEYCNDAAYFEEKIEQVRFYVFLKGKIEVESYYESGKAAVVLHGHLNWTRAYSLSRDYSQRHEDSECIATSAR
jgi:hypothetical protein